MFNDIAEASEGIQYVYPKRTIDNLHIGKPILDFGMDGDDYKDSLYHSGFYKSPEDRIRDAVKDDGVLYLQSDIYENLDRRLDEHQKNNPLNDKPADAVEESLDENNKKPTAYHLMDSDISTDWKKHRKLLYGNTPEQYADDLAESRRKAAMPNDENGWSTSGSGFTQSMEEWYLKRLLAANDQLEPDDPRSPIQRNNQPMASNISTNWKDDNGNYMPAVAFSKALLDDKTGGSFKDTLNNQSDGDRQEWLNNHHGGRGLGYMGQNKFHRQPSRYGPGTTYNMDERRANVQDNALRFFRSRGYRV